MKGKKNIIIIGAGGHARVIIDTAEQLNFKIKGIIDINFKNQDERILDYPVLGDFSVLQKVDPVNTTAIVALGDTEKRSYYFHQIAKLGFSMETLIHPTAIVSKHAKIGKGVFVNVAAIINSAAIIKDNVIINTGAIIDHETEIGEHCHIGPGVKIAGRVKIGHHSFIGIGTTIIDKITVGDNVIIGAGTVVINNIYPHSTVVGVPGKRIK